MNDRNTSQLGPFSARFEHQFPLFEGDAWPARNLGEKVIRMVYVDEVRRIEPLFHSYMKQLKGTVLKCDHTFKVCNYVRVQYEQTITTMLTFQNEHSEVLAYYLWNTKSMKDLTEEIKLVVQRMGGGQAVKCIYVDNPVSGKIYYLH
jgi:hypothetical protein